jgi:small subunit ribosomal protein S2
MIQNMLDAGVHFGHRAQRWNPAMAPYIYGQKYGIHIIDILKTVECLQQACIFMQRTKNQKVLFVGTKRSAAYLVELAANECSGDAYFINHRWLGGFLTNWTTMRGCLYRLHRLDPERATSKKERLLMTKQHARLTKFFRGVADMRTKPDALVIVGQQEEMSAVQEARKLAIPTVTLVDTDCNPKLATYSIPANDDSVRSIQLILSKLVQARNA